MNKKIKSENRKIDFRDICFLLMGMILGIFFMFLWIYNFEMAFLNHLNIEDVVINFNETKMVDYAYSLVN